VQRSRAHALCCTQHGVLPVLVVAFQAIPILCAAPHFSKFPFYNASKCMAARRTTIANKKLLLNAIVSFHRETNAIYYICPMMALVRTILATTNLTLAYAYLCHNTSFLYSRAYNSKGLASCN
jgi:hypothetical protein